MQERKRYDRSMTVDGDVNAFAKVLVKTSPVTHEDLADLRGMFEFFCRSGNSSVYITSAQAVMILKRMGMDGAGLEENGGVLVQEGSTPKLLLNEQEFLLFAARLFRAEKASLLEEGQLSLTEKQQAMKVAKRFFHTLDVKRRGMVSAQELRDGLVDLQAKIDLEAASKVCEKIASLQRVLELEDEEDIREFSIDEFLSFAVPFLT